MPTSRVWICPACGNVAVYEGEKEDWCEETPAGAKHSETLMLLNVAVPLVECREGVIYDDGHWWEANPVGLRSDRPSDAKVLVIVLPTPTGDAS